MAKKTSYLTELIERHERWKAEGGGKHEEEEQASPEDRLERLPLADYHVVSDLSFRSAANSDPDDLWDFGTVRHAGRQATVNRPVAPPPPVNVPSPTKESRTANGKSNGQSSAPPSPTKERRSTEAKSRLSSEPRSGRTINSISSSITAKGDVLPPLPTSDPDSTLTSRFEDEGTVRRGQSPLATRISPQERESSESNDIEEYDDLEPYPAMEPQHDNNKILQEDLLLDTTMLDSVVLPAIASVSCLALCSIIEF